jgi:hypothetical protein
MSASTFGGAAPAGAAGADEAPSNFSPASAIKLIRLTEFYFLAIGGHRTF